MTYFLPRRSFWISSVGLAGDVSLLPVIRRILSDDLWGFRRLTTSSWRYFFWHMALGSCDSLALGTHRGGEFNSSWSTRGQLLSRSQVCAILRASTRLCACGGLCAQIERCILGNDLQSCLVHGQVWAQWHNDGER